MTTTAPTPLDSSRLEALATRLARLEWESRWWKRSATLALLALTLIGLTGQLMPPSRVVETEQLLLRDASGRIRVSLGALDDESVVLTFRDRLERDRLALGLLPGGAGLVSLYDGHRRRRAAFGMIDTDAPGLVLFGRDGTRRARVSLEDEAPRFVAEAADRTVLWEMPAPQAAQ